MSDLLERLKSAVSTLETWGNLADAKAVEQAESRIREQRALLDECKAMFLVMTQEGCGCCDIHALRMIDKLRSAQDNADETE